MLKNLSLFICLSFAALSSCGDTEVKAQTLPQVDISNNTQNEANQPLEKVDLTQLNRSQLQAEKQRVKNLRENLEKGMDDFAEDDPRWDILDAYLDREIEISKVELAAEKAETREAEERLRESCEMNAVARRLAGIDGISEGCTGVE